ncbi:LacI family DNA-binding transcriptional regulator [Arthrobacter rhizosphaerae]|uniref:LacI family DNA-binding transcriptional regulator n=1 Tax=Arthrobacter rhizosphaerae TaxID=2855490 RepID=UPI001FF4CA89|nr:LacI family DNA-binding transcriptional regulator [Arthrobacter rhizosphaerae]
MTQTPAGRRSQRATILDVAAAAGVSRQTVTRAMNDMPGIKTETRQRIQEVARELGYTPSRFAKGLVQGARTSVGLAIPDLTNPYFPAFASSVVEQATQRGWQVVMDDYGHGGRNGLDAVEHLAPHVDAVIGYLGGYAGQAQAILGRRPLIVLDEEPGSAAGAITFDYRHAAELAIGRLQGVGCSRIAYVDSVRAPEKRALEIRAPEDLNSGNRPSSAGGSAETVAHGRGADDGFVTSRGRAFAAVLEESYGGAFRCSAVAVEESASESRTAVRELLALQPGIDGIVAFNDLVASGVLKALSDAGKRVPEDCLVIGMDGIPLGEQLSPELTTLSLDLREVGRTAVELLDGLLGGTLAAGSAESRLILRHRLVVRQSA